MLLLCVTIEVRLGVEKVRIHQTRKEQPHIKHGGDGLRPRVKNKTRWCAEFNSIPGGKRLQAFQVGFTEG